MRVRIVGTELPGRRFEDASGGLCYDDVRVGLQRGREHEQLVPGDTSGAAFDLELTPAGDRDARGPYAQGRPGERFVYLVWVAGPEREMFRRAKLMLGDIPPAVWRDALAPDRALEATVRLTDACGWPRCARVRDDAVTWRAVGVEPAPRGYDGDMPSKRGGQKSGSGSSPKQGGTTAQKKEAGRRGGKATAKKSAKS